MDNQDNIKDHEESYTFSLNLNDELSELVDGFRTKSNTQGLAENSSKAKKMINQEILLRKKLLLKVKDKLKKRKLLNGETNKTSLQKNSLDDEEKDPFGISETDSDSGYADAIVNNAFHDETLEPLLISRMASLKDKISTLLKQCVEREEKKYSKLLKEADEISQKYDEAQRKLTAANSQLEEMKFKEREHDAAKLYLERQLESMIVQNNDLKSQIQELSKQKGELIEVSSKQMKLIYDFLEETNTALENSLANEY